MRVSQVYRWQIPMDAGVVLRERRLKTRDGLFIRLQEGEREGFRIPELRGQMRYWLRAIAGAVSSKLNDVQKLESRVLGA